MLVMTFLTNSGVTGILCNFKIVPEGKAGKAITESSRLEFLQKTTLGPLYRRGITDLLLLRTLFFVTDSCFIRIRKSGSFKKPFGMITSLFELHLRHRRFILLVQTIEVISMSYVSSTNS